MCFLKDLDCDPWGWRRAHLPHDQGKHSQSLSKRQNQTQGIHQVEILRASRIVSLDERKDVLLIQLVWILGLLGVTHMEAISPFPEEAAIVAGTVRGGGEAVSAVPRWCWTRRPLLHLWQL